MYMVLPLPLQSKYSYSDDGRMKTLANDHKSQWVLPLYHLFLEDSTSSLKLPKPPAHWGRAPYAILAATSKIEIQQSAKLKSSRLWTAWITSLEVPSETSIYLANVKPWSLKRGFK
ncbi:hypothetical protein LENED_001059 [Lentinula edodes]|uniref:Uncharacterized protein n=1 Tax=Lentinula edodes TaxID=5353 RepID=A0A1Q3DX62_LENED|nr:hypothetical protein LENED_001059 [Lentinula edodes]